MTEKEIELEIKVNRSKIYFTPIFNTCVNIQYFSLLVNTYFWYDNYGDESFCLLYKFDGRVKGNFTRRQGFTVYEKELFNHELFKGYSDYGEYVIYQFELTDEMLDFRNLLLEGKYSKMKSKYKDIIYDFNKLNYSKDDADYIRKVLNKDPELVQEICDKFEVQPQYVTEVLSEIIPERELFITSIVKTKRDEIKKIKL